MKRLLLALLLVSFTLGCLSYDGKITPEEVVVQTKEYEDEFKEYANSIVIYHKEISNETAHEINKNVSKILPQESTLAFMVNRGIINRGYVFQLNGSMSIISKVSLEEYTRHTDLYVENYLLKEGPCAGAAFELSGVSYDGSNLKMTIRNTGNVDFPVLYLLTAKGSTHSVKQYNVTFTPGEIVTLEHIESNLSLAKIYPEKCQFVEVKKGFTI